MKTIYTDTIKREGRTFIFTIINTNDAFLARIWLLPNRENPIYKFPFPQEMIESEESNVPISVLDAMIEHGQEFIENFEKNFMRNHY